MEKAYELGSNQAAQFIEKRLISKTEMFHATVKQNRLKTFATTPKVKVTSQDAKLKSDRGTFARMVIVAQSRKIDMRKTLSFPLSNVSAALASCDSQSIAKTTKSSLLALLEEKCTSVCSIDKLNNVTLIIDAMAFIQSFPRNKIPKTFGELASILLQNIIALAKRFEAKRVDFVGDQYPLTSIKTLERNRRGIQQAIIREIYSPLQETPKQWTKFLSSGANKQNLQIFIAKQWENEVVEVDIDLYVAVEQNCKLIKFSAALTTHITCI